MLPAAYRMRRSADFEQAVRRGTRAGRQTLVVHVTTTDRGTSGPAVGLVVSKAVGNAVVRNRVKRRLRALVRDREATLPVAGIVVRALPPAATEPFTRLGDDLDGALATALRRTRERAAATPRRAG